MKSFEEVSLFHGHQCPGLAMGYRMAGAAMAALASQRAEDEELVAIVENDACGVDALQYLTGCTFGKGNLLFRDHGKQVYTLYCRSSRKGVRVLFRGDRVPGEVKEERQAFMEWLLAAPEEEFLQVTPVKIDEPEPARIHESVICPRCGEQVMATRTRECGGQQVCIPCSRWV